MGMGDGRLSCTRVFVLAIGILALQFGLSSCTTPYLPHAGEDAAKLRVRLAPKSGFGACMAWCDPRLASSVGRLFAFKLIGSYSTSQCTLTGTLQRARHVIETKTPCKDRQ
jgi:hypothetical protein